MSLYEPWWNAMLWLRPAFSRRQTFLWFATAVAGMTVRTELLGVSSIVRALALKPCFYDNLLDLFHSAAVKLDQLTALWAQAAAAPVPGPGARQWPPGAGR